MYSKLVQKYINSLVYYHNTCSLQTEVNEVLGKRTAVTKEDLEKLQYTEQVKLIFDFNSIPNDCEHAISSVYDHIYVIANHFKVRMH